MGSVSSADLAGGLGDPAIGVRRRAAEIAAHHTGPDLVPMLSDPAPEVVEMAAWALGERGAAASVPDLASTARTHPDALCREAAVAAIGAIAAQAVCPVEGLAAVLDAMSDRPAVRRRAVLALAAFEGPAVRAALLTALTDHDWQVRQAAEDLISEG
jgi:HEAT repeat protein